MVQLAAFTANWQYGTPRFARRAVLTRRKGSRGAAAWRPASFGLQTGGGPVEHASADHRDLERERVRGPGRVAPGQLPDPGQPVGDGPHRQVQIPRGRGRDPT